MASNSSALPGRVGTDGSGLDGRSPSLPARPSHAPSAGCRPATGGTRPGRSRPSPAFAGKPDGILMPPPPPGDSTTWRPWASSVRSGGRRSGRSTAAAVPHPSTSSPRTASGRRSGAARGHGRPHRRDVVGAAPAVPAGRAHAPGRVAPRPRRTAPGPRKDRRPRPRRGRRRIRYDPGHGAGGRRRRDRAPEVRPDRGVVGHRHPRGPAARDGAAAAFRAHPLDYALLADQILLWQDENRRDEVRRTWGRDFHRRYGHSGPARADGESDEATADAAPMEDAVSMGDPETTDADS